MVLPNASAPGGRCAHRPPQFATRPAGTAGWPWFRPQPADCSIYSGIAEAAHSKLGAEVARGALLSDESSTQFRCDPVQLTTPLGATLRHLPIRSCLMSGWTMSTRGG